MRLLRAFSLVQATLNVFQRSLDEALDSSYRKVRVVRLLQGAGDLTMVVSDVCSMFVGAYLVLRKQLSLGSFIAFMNAFWRSATTLILVFNKLAEFHGYSATIDRVSAFMTAPSWRASHHVGAEISANSISFSYGTEAILRNVSISLQPGERSLIIGRNGSGKTTLANILCGHLIPTSGSLTLPARISGVTLPVLFPPMPVRDLPIDADLLSLLRINEAIILNSRPDLLSAGQQQKVALGLALSCEADLYVLDEPLANLDVASRRIAMMAIEERTADRMLVMVMHDAGEFRSLFDHVCILGQDDGCRTVSPLPADL